MKSLLELEQLVQETLSPRRYAHSVNVSREAVRLAQRYGEDAERARMALLPGLYGSRHQDHGLRQDVR